jgi:hypothetical protein
MFGDGLIHVRNRHPRHAIAIPFADGSRFCLVPAGATSMLPDAALRHPAVRLLLAGQLIVVVDAAQYDADARQERAGRIDITELARQAEQAEFDRLLAGMRRPGPQRPQREPRPRKPRADEWSPAQVELLRRRHAAGASLESIAIEVGRTLGAVVGMTRREGLRRPRQRPPSTLPAEWTETLRRRWGEGVPGRKIAGELGTKPTIVWARVNRLGLEKRFDNRNGGRWVSLVRNTLGALS